MHLRSFNSRWDSYVNPKYDIASISMDKVRRFISMCNEGKNFIITDDLLTTLKNFELVSEISTTSDCFLLFAQSDVFIVVIEVGRLATPINIKDGLTVRSCLFTEVETYYPDI